MNSETNLQSSASNITIGLIQPCWRLLLLVAGVLLFSSDESHAQIVWGNVTGSPNPYYHNSNNWIGNIRPGSSDIARFEFDENYEVWWSTTTESLAPEVGQIQVINGDVTFRSKQLVGLRKLQINGLGGGAQYSDFQVSGGDTSLSLFGVHMQSLGGAELTSGARLVIGSPGEVAPLMTVGSNFDASGQFLVQSGGRVEIGSSSYIGRLNGSTGNATVIGNSSRWDSSDLLIVGGAGDGNLNVMAGGVVSSYRGILASGSGSTATARVSGSGSRWNATYGLDVGNFGDGVLEIENGGQVASLAGRIGTESGSTGDARVSGNGSQWINNGSILVGREGSGQLRVDSGGVVSNATGYIGEQAGASGTATVTGNDSLWNNSLGLYVGETGNGTLNISDGATVRNTTGQVGNAASSVGIANVTGNGSQWVNSSSLNLGRSGSGTLNVMSGGTVSNTFGRIGWLNESTGQALVSGPGSQWNNSSAFYVGVAATGALTVENGGYVSSSTGYIALSATSNGVATVTGAGSRWDNEGNLFIAGNHLNAGGNGTLTIADNGLVSVGGATRIWSTGTVNLEGGRFEFGQTTLAELESINSVSGSLAGVATHGGYTDVSTLTSLQNSNVDFNDVSLSNSGVLYGTGSLGSALVNNTLGEVETMVGERMRFVGSGSSNAGEINNFGGNIRFDQDLTNQSGGLVGGRGTFIANGGWNNQGAMAFIGGFSEVLGDVSNSSDGMIVISGGSTTTFYDDVVHNGSEIRTAAGSNAVFLGEVSGAGPFTGAGTVFMEGDLRPGNSPSVVSFEGDLVMGSGAVLFAELGGLQAGQFDQLDVDGNLTLNGALQVALIDGFELSLNNQFLIGDVDGLLQGQFDGLDEGSLVGNFNGLDLFISYAGGDGNDVVLFTAVPEPAMLPFLGLGSALFAVNYRRRK